MGLRQCSKKSLGSLRLLGSRAPAVLNLLSLHIRAFIFDKIFGRIIRSAQKTNCQGLS